MHYCAFDKLAPSTRNDFFRILLWTLGSVICLILWDTSGLDLMLARAFGDSQGFPLRSSRFLVSVMHEGTRRLAWVVVLALVFAIWWPFGVLRAANQSERVQLAVTTLLALAIVTAVKYTSATSCPWDLAEFGGVARHVSHWAWGTFDGGSGKCFPGGHASAGFAFVSGYFALRRSRPQAARIWLGCAIGAGLILGFSQQMRGAHFQSHTLWTGWLCWTCAWMVDLAMHLRPVRDVAVAHAGGG
ncbi:MAG: phosphatase PAP2 family protein [Giesbergeria sp.]